jgi:hypothetical protein
MPLQELLTAIKENNLANVKLALHNPTPSHGSQDQKSFINEKNADGDTPLLLAVGQCFETDTEKQTQLAIVQTLLKYKANINVRDKRFIRADKRMLDSKNSKLSEYLTEYFTVKRHIDGLQNFYMHRTQTYALSETTLISCALQGDGLPDNIKKRIILDYKNPQQYQYNSLSRISPSLDFLNGTLYGSDFFTIYPSMSAASALYLFLKNNYQVNRMQLDTVIDGQNLLTIAVTFNDENMVLQLLKYGVKTEVTGLQQPPLALALRPTHGFILCRLLQFNANMQHGVQDEILGATTVLALAFYKVINEALLPIVFEMFLQRLFIQQGKLKQEELNLFRQHESSFGKFDVLTKTILNYFLDPASKEKFKQASVGLPPLLSFLLTRGKL